MLLWFGQHGDVTSWEVVLAFSGSDFFGKIAPFVSAFLGTWFPGFQPISFSGNTICQKLATSSSAFLGSWIFGKRSSCGNGFLGVGRLEKLAFKEVAFLGRWIPEKQKTGFSQKQLFRGLQSRKGFLEISPSSESSFSDRAHSGNWLLVSWKATPFGRLVS